jgi:hypothetical protein
MLLALAAFALSVGLITIGAQGRISSGQVMAG